jgi:hypothetical protein
VYRTFRALHGTDHCEPASNENGGIASVKIVVHGVVRKSWPFSRHRVEISLSRLSDGSRVRTIWSIPGKNDSGQPRA